MAEQVQISAVIITFNEERNLADCLASVQSFADEIVVVDSGSQDSTLEIAKSFGAKVCHKDFDGFIEQKNYANQKAAYDWIFSIDADERVSPTLRDKIMKIKQSGVTAHAFRVNRLNYYINGWFKKGGWYPDKKIRFFRQDMAFWHGGKVHESLAVKEGAVVQDLRADLLHYTYLSLDEHLNQIARYTTLSAEEKFRQGKHRNRFNLWLHILLNPWVKFVKTYFIKGAIWEGTRGFVFAIMASYYVFLKYAKLWGLYQNRENPPD